VQGIGGWLFFYKSDFEEMIKVKKSTK